MFYISICLSKCEGIIINQNGNPFYYVLVSVSP